MDLQGKVNPGKKAIVLTLDDLPSGHYLAFVQNMEKPAFIRWKSLTDYIVKVITIRLE